MARFTDKTGQDWVIEPTIADILRVRADTGVDLMKLDQPLKPGSTEPLMTELELDLELLCTVVFHLVKAQGKDGVTDMMALMERVGAEHFKSMHNAFWAGMLDFFRKGGREMQAAQIEKMLQMLGIAVEVVLARLDKLDGPKARKAIEQTLGEPSLGSPEPSELTPAA
jgi:hypothetical protein